MAEKNTYIQQFSEHAKFVKLLFSECKLFNFKFSFHGHLGKDKAVLPHELVESMEHCVICCCECTVFGFLFFPKYIDQAF